MIASSATNGRKLPPGCTTPIRGSGRAERVSRSVPGAIVFRRLVGVITSNRRRLSGHCWDSTRPASIVLPKPTSSASSAPLESGDLDANSAASTW
jgi:hypothetical protein